jgi:hypothetical protein
MILYPLVEGKNEIHYVEIHVYEESAKGAE